MKREKWMKIQSGKSKSGIWMNRKKVCSKNMTKANKLAVHYNLDPYKVTSAYGADINARNDVTG